MSADITRIELSRDGQAVTLVALSTVPESFAAKNDRLTVFVVQNDSEVSALTLTITPTLAAVASPHGKVAPSNIVVSVDAGDDALYAFRIPPQIYNGLDGLVTIARTNAVGKIWSGRIPFNMEYKGATIALAGEPVVRVAVSQEPTAITFAAIADGDLVRKGVNSIWLARQATGTARMLCLQTDGASVSRNFGREFGVLDGTQAEFPAAGEVPAPFVISPVDVPGDDSIVAFVRPLGAYAGVTGDAVGAGGAVLVRTEAAAAMELARLDIQA